jgi:serine/threonine-protein kinase
VCDNAADLDGADLQGNPMADVPPRTGSAEPVKILQPAPSAGDGLDPPTLPPQPARELPSGVASQAQGDTLPPPQGPPNQPVAGYEVLGELGRGGMGVVYRARHVALNRLVALKMILHGVHAGEREVTRFRVEAEALARLQHPGIVQIHEVGESDGRPFCALEYVAGGSLDKKLNGTPLPARQAAQLVQQLAQAMHAAHQQGIIHRDLKPQNVLLARSDRLQAVPLGASPAEAAYYEPKITDFGLAKRLDVEPRVLAPGGLTQSGAILGTPSYMAPEQALGQRQHIGPATDLYALGAILYELLTGRPPFNAAEVLDVLYQVVSAEPVPPTRLAAKVPRDLETICLKCLRKEPRQRYASAEELAEDLGRFLAGEPIRARPVGRVEKAFKWVKRRPAVAALWAAGVLAVLLVVGGWAWLEQQAADQRARDAELRAREAEREARLRQGVATALSKAADLQQQANWGAARAVLDQVQAQLHGAPADMRRQVEQAQADLRLVSQLDAVRLKAATWVQGGFDYVAVERDYAEAFRAAGLGQPGEKVQTVAARVRRSAVKQQLVAALDDWASIVEWASRRAWLLAVARQADRDPSRDRFRDPRLWRDRAALERLADQASVKQLSPQLLTMLAKALRRAGGEAVPLLTAAQQRYPQDFWLNFHLGFALQGRKQAGEAVGYCRAALALRPTTYAVYINLGTALYDKGQRDEAIACFEKALALDPKNAQAHTNLGAALQDKGQLDRAIACFEKALALDPKDAKAHFNLGNALHEKGQWDEAIACYRKALAIDPKLARAHTNLGIALYAKGQLDRAIECYQKALALDPKSVKTHNNLGNALQAKGQLDGAIACYEKALALDPKLAQAHHNLGAALQAKGDLDGAIACYQKALALDPKFALAHYNLGNALKDKGQLDQAIACWKKALALNPKHAQAQSHLGIALSTKGQWDQAIACFQKALALDPRATKVHVNLGIALQTKGQLDQAIACFQKALAIDPKNAQAYGALGVTLLQQGRIAEARDSMRHCLQLLPKGHPLRQFVSQQLAQYERLLALDARLPALLKGTARLTAAEHLEYAQLCGLKKLFAAATRFSATAFAADPKLADNLLAGHRYNAACNAALAGSGQGQDAAQLDASERARLRRQALTWLRADLARWAKILDSGIPQARVTVQEKLQHWQRVPDLAGIRDAAWIVNLPADELRACRQLWADVQALLQRTSDQK